MYHLARVCDHALAVDRAFASSPLKPRCKRLASLSLRVAASTRPLVRESLAFTRQAGRKQPGPWGVAIPSPRSRRITQMRQFFIPPHVLSAAPYSGGW